MRFHSKFLYRAFTKLAKIFNPAKKRHTMVIPEGFISPDLKFISADEVKKYINKYKNNHSDHLTFIDIGGRQGEFKAYSKGFEYKILEINENIQGENVIYGDITNCPMIEDNSFDICFSNNVFEHIKEPWKAAEECVRITKLNGLILVLAPFSWRYHPDPVDYFRYSHSGLSFLFERTGLVETIISSYDISERRKDHRGGKVEGGLDIPPIDELGGWREHWLTIFIGRKSGKKV